MADFEVKIEDDEQEEKEFVATYNLSSYGIDFDVSGLVRRMNAGSIYLPDFQRNYVWDTKRASKFIESLLLGLPIPSVCLHKEEDNKQIIIDGKAIRAATEKCINDNIPFIVSTYLADIGISIGQVRIENK